MNKFNLHPELKKHPVLYSIRLLLSFTIFFPIFFIARKIYNLCDRIMDFIEYHDLYDSSGKIKYWKNIYNNAYHYKEKDYINQEIEFDYEE